MANFDSGVKSYIIGKAEITVGFPVDDRGRADVSCNQCPYYARNSKTCMLNKQIVHYPDSHLGAHCILEFTGEVILNEKNRPDK